MLLIMLVIFINAGCDQVSKMAVRQSVGYHEPVRLLDDNFILMKVENRGAFFGLGEDLPPVAKTAGLLILPALAMLSILLFTLMRPELSKTISLSLGCIVGGGIGNLFDRFMHGSVTDFLHIDLGGIFKTGIFNLADVSIFLGMILLLLNIRKFR